MTEQPMTTTRRELLEELSQLVGNSPAYMTAMREEASIDEIREQITKHKNLPAIVPHDLQPTADPAPWQALAPRTYSELQSFASQLAVSEWVPRAYRGKPGDIMLAIQWGAEIGLRPLQSVNGIAVVNGRPAVWGDDMLALVWASRLQLEYDDWLEGDEKTAETLIGWAKSHRKGTPGPVTRKFSYHDAKSAALWGKAGPWQQYRGRMLRLRARGFLLRDLYPDVLRGLITVEEAQDISNPA